MALDARIDAAEEGLVAYWNFDDGQGTAVRDQSGNGNDGMVHDAKWLKNKTGYCLEFDGQTSWVDCGSGPVSTCARQSRWKPGSSRPDNRAASRAFSASSSRATSSLTTPTATPGSTSGQGRTTPTPRWPWARWSLLTATFDGKMQRLYVNGKLLPATSSTFDRIPEGGRFTIGMVAGKADAGDPAYRNTARL